MRQAAVLNVWMRLARHERGLISVSNLFLLIIICCIGALALDVTRLYEARSQLQVSADLASHAALYTRRYGSYEDGVYHPLTDEAAEAAAIAAVEFGAPSSFFGATIDADQIVLGYWNHDTGLVDTSVTNTMEDADPADLALIRHVPDSAAVITDRAGANAVRNFLFRMAGIPTTNVATGAVFTLGPGECDPTQGFFSQDEVQMNGRNIFFPGFCVGAPTVWVRNLNEFRPGVSVVTETRRGLELSGSDPIKNNPGLMASYSYGPEAYTPIDNYMDSELGEVTTVLSPVPAAVPPSLAAEFDDHNYAYNLLGEAGWTQVVADRTATPNTTLVTDPTVTLAGARSYVPSQLATNRVNYINCPPGNGPDTRITLGTAGTDSTYRNMAIFTDCQVTITGNAKLEDFVLSTTDASDSGHISIQTSSGLTIGKDDDCAPTGGAALITRGGFNAAAQTLFYGAVVRALKTVNFQSNAIGQGLSIISGKGKVDTNSRNIMAVCGPAAGTVSRDVSLRLRQ